MGESMHAPLEALVELAEIRAGQRATESSVSSPWAEHVARCAECGRGMNEFEEILRSLREGDSGDAPDTWIRRAELRAVPRHAVSGLKGELRGDLVFDNAFDRFSGTRADSLLVRQFVVAADRLQIEISLAPEGGPDRWPLTGQIFVGEGPPVPLRDCRVALIEEGIERDRTTATENGEFMLESRPRGRFELRIQGEDWVVVTPALVP